ncbi:single-stranded-DNA-specific exonuclease RecJ, partial [Escherichia coli]
IEAFGDFLSERLDAAVTRAMGDRALLLDAVLSARGVTPDLVTTMEAGGPYGMGWPQPRVVAGPVRVLKADVVGNGHVRAIVSGDCPGGGGGTLKAVAFRQ